MTLHYALKYYLRTEWKQWCNRNSAKVLQGHLYLHPVQYTNVITIKNTIIKPEEKYSPAKLVTQDHIFTQCIQIQTLSEVLPKQHQQYFQTIFYSYFHSYSINKFLCRFSSFFFYTQWDDNNGCNDTNTTTAITTSYCLVGVRGLVDDG